MKPTTEQEARRVLHQLQRYPLRAEALLKELASQRGGVFAQQVRDVLEACRVPPGLTRTEALAFVKATKFRRPKELR